MAIIYETVMNASVIKAINATTPAPLTQPIECRPVGGLASVIDGVETATFETETSS